MKVYENNLYIEDIKKAAALDLPWERLQDKSVLISGATGLVGSCFIDLIMERNIFQGMTCKVSVLGRNAQKAKDRFGYCLDSSLFCFIAADINKPLVLDGYLHWSPATLMCCNIMIDFLLLNHMTLSN